MLRLVLLTRWKDAPGAKAEAEAAKQSAIAEEESFMVNYHGLYLSNVQGFMRRRCFRLLSSSEQGDNKGSGEWLLSLMMLPCALSATVFAIARKLSRYSSVPIITLRRASKDLLTSPD